MALNRLVSTLLALITLFLLTPQVAPAAGGGGHDAGAGMNNRSRGKGSALQKAFVEGTKFLTDGECKKAEKRFKAILKHVPRNPEANFLRGTALQCQNKHKAAIRYLAKAKRYDEELYAAYQMLGISYLELGRSDDAQEQLDELERFLDGCGADCPEKLTRAHSKLDGAMRAVGGADSASPADPASNDQHGLLFDPIAEPQTVYLSAIQLIHSEQFEEAIEELRRLTSTIGPHPDVLNYLGYAHRRIGLFERAEGFYEQALAIDPLHRGANEYLGEMYVQLGRIEAARRHLAILDRACPFGCAEYEDLDEIIGSHLAAAR